MGAKRRGGGPGKVREREVFVAVAEDGLSYELHVGVVNPAARQAAGPPQFWEAGRIQIGGEEQERAPSGAACAIQMP